MKRWRKVVIVTMILALPISMWASVAMASHCQTSDDTSHTMHMNDDDMHGHLHDQTSEDNASEHSDCDCGCDDSIDCSASGCSASVLSNTIKFNFNYLSQSTFQQIQVRLEPSDPNLLFRPPIISS